MKDGKLFGKINIIDLLVVLIAIFVVVMVVLKMTGHLGGGTAQTATTKVVYTARVERIRRDVYEAARAFVEDAKANGKEGDQLMANGELLNAYITDVTAEDHADVTIGAYNGGFSVVSADDTLDVTFTIVAYGVDTITTKVGTQEVRVGKAHIIKTTHFEFASGSVVTCDWESGTAAD